MVILPPKRRTPVKMLRILTWSEGDAQTLEGVAPALPKIFPGARVQIERRAGEQNHCYDRERRQYSAEAILGALPISPPDTFEALYRSRRRQEGTTVQASPSPRSL